MLPAAETPALPGSLHYALQLNPSSSLDRLLYHYSHTVAGDFLALLDLVCRLGVRLCTAPELPPTTAKRLKVDRHPESQPVWMLDLLITPPMKPRPRLSFLEIR